MGYTCGYKFRFYPTKEQRINLAQTFGCVRYIYNWGLEQRSNAYHDEGESLSYTDTSKRLTKLKKRDDHDWLSDVSSVPTQQALRHLEKAYTRFFKGDAKFPDFKRKHAKQSAEYTTSGYRLKGDDPKRPDVYLAKQKKPLKIRWSRPLPSKPKTVTVTKDKAGRYFIAFRVEPEPETLPMRNKSVGLDMGIKHTVVTSDGFKSKNPKYTEHDLCKLRRAQQALSRKEKGSNNWKRQKRRIAKIHAKIRDRRADYLHKLTTRLVREYDVICVETLRVQNMQQNRCLSRAISDVGWGELVRQLKYKCEWYGRTLVKIDQWYPSSKRCHECGHVKGELSLDEREWTCAKCGHEHDRGLNAAKNVLAAGQAVSAPGEPGKSTQGFKLAGSAR